MFDFKQFHIDDSRCAMKVGTDGVLLGAWADAAGCSRILDAGTGSGLIALMLAQRFPDAKITGIDIDPGCCLDAEANVSASRFASRIDINCLNFSEIKISGFFDFVISNPPFFTESLRSSDLGRASARHEEEFGVTSLLEVSGRQLPYGGSVALIAPSSREDEIEFLAELSRLSLRRRCRVSSVEGKPPLRTLYQFVKGRDVAPVTTTLDIRRPDGSFTDAYKELTSEFYL